MDLKKIWDASVLPITLALVLNIFIDVISGEVLYLLNLLIYTYAGYRAGHSYRMGFLGGGMVASVSFCVAHTILSVISPLLYLVYSGKAVQGISETVTPAIDLGILAPYIIVIFLFILIPGIIINFIIGAVAAYFVTRRWNDESISDIIERAKNSQKMNRKMPW